MPPVLAAFTARHARVSTTVGVATAGEVAALLHERLADVCFGPRLSGGLESVPVMRYGLIVAASPAHHLADAVQIPWPALIEEDWLVDPSAMDSSSEVGMLLGKLHVPADRVRVFPSLSAAWAAAQEGHGVAPAISHLVAGDLQRGALRRLDVVDTPVHLLWYVSALPNDRRAPGVTALLRFLGTPEAMQSMHRSDGGVPASRFRPPVYVTLWS